MQRLKGQALSLKGTLDGHCHWGAGEAVSMPQGTLAGLLGHTPWGTLAMRGGHQEAGTLQVRPL